jgi:hypothetical protein
MKVDQNNKIFVSFEFPLKTHSVLYSPEIHWTERYLTALVQLITISVEQTN